MMPTFRANFLHRGKWWVAWTDDVPGAVTQGRTLASARENLKDAIALMLEPVSIKLSRGQRKARSSSCEADAIDQAP